MAIHEAGHCIVAVQSGLAVAGVHTSGETGHTEIDFAAALNEAKPSQAPEQPEKAGSEEETADRLVALGLSREKARELENTLSREGVCLDPGRLESKKERTIRELTKRGFSVEKAEK